CSMLSAIMASMVAKKKPRKWLCLSAAKATFCRAATARGAEAGVSLEIKMGSGNKALENQISGYRRGAQTAACEHRRNPARRGDLFFFCNVPGKATKHFGFWYNRLVFGVDISLQVSISQPSFR